MQGKVGWTIVQGYSFKQVSLTWKRQKNSPRAINWKRSNKNGANVAPSSTYKSPPKDCPVGITIRKAKKGLGDGVISI